MLSFLQMTSETGGAGSGPLPVLILTAATPIIVAAIGLVNHRKGKSRDETRKTEFQQLQETIAGNHAETTQQFNAVAVELTELRAFVVGPDGKNGLRGDVREIKTRVDGLVERERDRLEQQALHGYDRRS